MKNIYKNVLVTILFSVFMSVTAQAQEPLQEVVHYIRSGNVTGMARYFDKNITITINNDEASYSASQAQIIMKDFFSKNPVQEFSVAQGGNNGTRAQYAIGDLTTSTGMFQLYVEIKLHDDKFLIQALRFEKIEKPAR